MAPIGPITGQHPRCARDWDQFREFQVSLRAETANYRHDGNLCVFTAQTARLLLTLLSEHRANLLVARRLAAAQLGEAHPQVGEYHAQLLQVDQAIRELAGDAQEAA